MLLLGYLPVDKGGAAADKNEGESQTWGNLGNYVRETHSIRQGLLMVLRVLSTSHHNQNGVWSREPEW